MVKRITSWLVILSMVFALTACFGPKAEEFSGTGITIELTDEFNFQETVVAPFYLVSMKHVFIGMRESKTDLASYSITNLGQYINGILDNAGKTATVYDDTLEDVTFKYAYYTSTVDGVEYGYMLLVMEGASHFYSMNFGCLAKDLEKNKDQFMDWAATITVE